MKKAECQRTDALELWYWRRLLRASWTARRSNKPILKEGSPGITLEGMMLKAENQFIQKPQSLYNLLLLKQKIIREHLLPAMASGPITS